MASPAAGAARPKHLRFIMPPSAQRLQDYISSTRVNACQGLKFGAGSGWVEAREHRAKGLDPSRLRLPHRGVNKQSLRSGATLAQPQSPAPLTEPGAIADAQPTTTPIEGFRHTHFGMSEQQVRQAIQKGFLAVADRLSRMTHPHEKTPVLTLCS